MNGSRVPIWVVLIVFVGLFTGAMGILYGRLMAVEAMSNANAVSISVNTERILAIQKNLNTIEAKLDKIIEIHTYQVK